MVYLHDACFELTASNIPADIYTLTSSWLRVQFRSSFSTIDQVRALHPLTIQDPVISAVFHGNISFYSTVFIRDIRSTTTDYSPGKISDDSNIIFTTNYRYHFG